MVCFVEFFDHTFLKLSYICICLYFCKIFSDKKSKVKRRYNINVALNSCRFFAHSNAQSTGKNTTHEFYVKNLFPLNEYVHNPLRIFYALFEKIEKHTHTHRRQSFFPFQCFFSFKKKLTAYSFYFSTFRVYSCKNHHSLSAIFLSLNFSACRCCSSDSGWAMSSASYFLIKPIFFLLHSFLADIFTLDLFSFSHCFIVDFLNISYTHYSKLVFLWNFCSFIQFFCKISVVKYAFFRTRFLSRERCRCSFDFDGVCICFW